MLTLDTNVLIYYAAEDKSTVDFLSSRRYEMVYVPSIAAVEFLSYPLITSQEVILFRSFVSQVIMVNLDFPIAEVAADLRRKHKMSLADSVIAASALLTHSTLVTRNIRDFKKVKELAMVSP